MSTHSFVGIDVGASTTKAIILNADAEVLGYAVTDSGADFEGAAGKVFEKSLEKAKRMSSEKCSVVSTGYGRRNVPFAASTKTEISCHAKGSYFYYPKDHTLIDIGGQDH